MKVIFLDIDGVLNGYNFWNLSLFKLVSPFPKIRDFVRRNYDIFGVHESKVKRLAKITKATGAVIVISSSWRGGWFTKYEEKSDRHKRLEDLFKKYNIKVIDITPKYFNGKRCDEILSWLSKHEEKVERFIVIDDESFDLQCFVDKELIKTSDVKDGDYIRGHWKENTGLRRKHVKQAIKVLNS